MQYKKIVSCCVLFTCLLQVSAPLFGMQVRKKKLTYDELQKAIQRNQRKLKNAKTGKEIISCLKTRKKYIDENIVFLKKQRDEFASSLDELKRERGSINYILEEVLSIALIEDYNKVVLCIQENESLRLKTEKALCRAKVAANKTLGKCLLFPGLTMIYFLVNRICFPGEMLDDFRDSMVFGLFCFLMLPFFASK